TEIGDRKGEATDYGNLGTVFELLNQYDKAKEYLQKALVITTEIGDRNGEASCYGNLGAVFLSLNQYDEAKEYLQKALVIRTEIGDRRGEATDYGNLGNLFESTGQYDKAREYLQKALDITTEIGDRDGEASCYGNLGNLFGSIGQYDKAKKYHQKALVINTQIGDRKGKASCYGNLGNVFLSLGQYDEAREHFQEALAITTEIGDKAGEAADLSNLGSLSLTVGDYEASKVWLEKALFISRDIGDRGREFEILKDYALLYLCQNEIKDALSFLHLCIEKYDKLRYFLGASDRFKTSFLEHSGIFPYKLLSTLLCDTGNARNALYVEELGRARGLSDLMAEKYSVETHISANPQSWSGIENILRKKNNCTCLYISYFRNHLHLWILKTTGVLHCRKISPKENLVQAGLPKDLSLSQFLDDNFRSLGILPTKDCEDRSLNTIKLQPLSPAQKSSARLRLLEEDEDKDKDKDKEVISSLSLCYKMFIAPVYDLLEEPEVIIVPDRRLYKVPFAALSEKEGAEYLSETHRIRVIPSLTTLKMIQDSPEDYHSNTGALIIGNPKVYWLPPLPGARKEAEMVGRLLGVPPLVEEEATKQAVLERISSVSLIHFAAHGSAERGEIALSSIPTPNNQNAIPPPEAHMLTMADVSRVKVRAKLLLGQYDKAKEYLQKALAIKTAIGHRKGEGTSLVISTEISDRRGEGSCYGNLGTVFKSLGQYDMAIENGEGSCHDNLGTVFHSLGQYDEAKEYFQEAFLITTEIDNREGEGSCYANLGSVFESLGQYDKAKEYLKKALVIATEIDHIKGDAGDYGNLGIICRIFGDYKASEVYLEKALSISRDIGDRRLEFEVLCSSRSDNRTRLKSISKKRLPSKRRLATEKEKKHSLGQYDKAKEYYQKVLVISTEISDIGGEGSCYGNLGAVFKSLGQYDMAIDAERYGMKLLVLLSETGDLVKEGNSLGEYHKAKEYLQKALVIRTKIGDRIGEAADYGNLGTVFKSLGQYDKAKEYLQKALRFSSQLRLAIEKERHHATET
ncbi:hypothetical protein pdam_00014174, partial [Pocillopora damicornis]